eukprot:2864550-Pleurochrysis_carterae.AAC.2
MLDCYFVGADHLHLLSSRSARQRKFVARVLLLPRQRHLGRRCIAHHAPVCDGFVHLTCLISA